MTEKINRQRLIDDGFKFSFLSGMFMVFKKEDELALYDQFRDAVYTKDDRYDGKEHYNWSEDETPRGEGGLLEDKLK